MLRAVTGIDRLETLAARLDAGGAVDVGPVADGGVPFLLVWLAAATGRPVVAVTDTRRALDELADDLDGYGELVLDRDLRILPFPPWEAAVRSGGAPGVESVVDRLTALTGLRNPARPVVFVTCVEGLLQKTIAPGALRDSSVEIVAGDTLALEPLRERLVTLGYSHERQVHAPGEFAVRGGILDVFSPAEPGPVRIEFFGDSIETVRRFEVSTQRSSRAAPQVRLTPAGELGILRADPAAGASLTDHFPPDTLLVWVRPARILDQVGRFEEEGDNDGDGAPPAFPWSFVVDRIRGGPHGRVGLKEEETSPSMELGAEWYPLELQPLDAYAPAAEGEADGVSDTARRLFFDQLCRWQRQGYRIEVCCNNEGERRRFREIVDELHLPLDEAVGERLARISRGFVFPEARLAVVTDAEIFARYRTRRPRRARKRVRGQDVAPLAGLDELVAGDHVVHVQHGIGKFLGLRELEVDGRPQEVLAVEYAEGARLYVPVDQCHLLSRYIGGGRRPPELHRLGGIRWAKNRAAAERAVEDLAADLLRVQALRETLRGHAFAADSPWQREFEAAFPYEETPDQAEAIEQVKNDMESERPMDRLICGDVGYGKTEVAMRAAFKAVMDGRQVGMLVPTTVLAQQHFDTFRERMADYPVRVEMLSRFRSRAAQREVLAGLAEGTVDIVIGTHRLLQRDILFKDLGLIVIDEEQRFGVLHKERLKRMREMVDVLTLTATPIPRTLHLALANARDMSTIQTPPQDRLPVETRVAGYSDKLVREFIVSEIRRGGQVYYLHNRVRTIEAIAERLRDLVPEASFEVGHGQMHERELETIMSRFVAAEFDVLVCTTIIESGLDIPNVNTIIIDRADRFGLADLYQLRGRVGRYRVQAHACLLLPRHGVLLDTARKRIGAIRRYSSLGSGFRIAMRDLEIRGAGNLLGREQSGHIAAVGFDFYCRLLREAVGRMKGESAPERLDVTVRIPFLSRGRDPSARAAAEVDLPAMAAEPDPAGTVPALLPADYIDEDVLRIEIYRRIADVADESAVDEVRGELEDRFGPPPAEARRLLEVARIRVLAGAAGVDSVETDRDRILLARRGQLFRTGTRFPRMTGGTADERLGEIVALLRTFRAPGDDARIRPRAAASPPA